MFRKIGMALFTMGMLLLAFPSAEAAGRSEIEWLTLEEALERAKKEPRPIMMDVYTDWCGWCKRMDVYTFTNPTICDYISRKFYAVKFNAEMKSTVTYQGRDYKPHEGHGRGAHSLVVMLTNGRLSYPTTIYLDAQGNLLTVVPGYYAPRDLEPILHFIADEAYRTTSWEDFLKGFKGSI